MRQIFCLGLPKTGTQAVCRMFSPYASAHDAWAEQFIDVIMSGDEVRIDKFLLRKHAGLKLSMDASYLNGFVLNRLMVLFPSAKFILTVRDCFGWISHFTEHCCNCKDGHWRLFWDWQIAKSMKFETGEGCLKDLGLYPLEEYIQHWTEYNRCVLDTVPKDRLLVFKFLDINGCADKIAALAGIHKNSLGRGYEDMPSTNHRVLKELDHALMWRKVREISDDVRKRLDF